MKFAFFKQTPIGISRVDVGMITCDMFQSKRTIHPEANIAYMVHFQVALYYPFSGAMFVLGRAIIGQLRSYTFRTPLNLPKLTLQGTYPMRIEKEVPHLSQKYYLNRRYVSSWKGSFCKCNLLLLTTSFPFSNFFVDFFRTSSNDPNPNKISPLTRESLGFASKIASQATGDQAPTAPRGKAQPGRRGRYSCGCCGVVEPEGNVYIIRVMLKV